MKARNMEELIRRKYDELNENDLEILLEEAQMDLTVSGTFAKEWMQILKAYETALKTENFSMDEGQQRADNLLEELNIENMELNDTEKALWFPTGTFPSNEADSTESCLWQGNPKDGCFAYTYSYSRNSLPVLQAPPGSTHDFEVPGLEGYPPLVSP